MTYYINSRFTIYYRLNDDGTVHVNLPGTPGDPEWTLSFLQTPRSMSDMLDRGLIREIPSSSLPESLR